MSLKLGPASPFIAPVLELSVRNDRLFRVVVDAIWFASPESLGGLDFQSGQSAFCLMMRAATIPRSVLEVRLLAARSVAGPDTQTERVSGSLDRRRLLDVLPQSACHNVCPRVGQEVTNNACDSPHQGDDSSLDDPYMCAHSRNAPVLACVPPLG
jgi:hypothetical protein